MSAEKQNPYEKEYGGVGYTQIMSLKRLDTTPGQTDKVKDSLVLANEYLLSWTIQNDLLTPMPTIKVTFKDIGAQQLPKYKPDGYTFLSLYLDHVFEDKRTSNEKSIVEQDAKKKTVPKNQRKRISPDGLQVTVVHTFIVRDIKILNKDTSTNSITYEIEGISSNDAIWQSNPIYSTNSASTDRASGVQSSVAFHEMMSDAGYPMINPATYNMTHTEVRMPFITPSTTKVCEMANYLLRLSSSDKGIYYFLHSLVENKGKIVCMNDEFEQGIPQFWNYIALPDRNAFDKIEFSTQDLKSSSFMGGTKQYNSTRPFGIKIFDYTTREWTTDDYNFRRIREFFPVTASDEYVKIFKEIPMAYSTGSKFYEEHLPTRYTISEKMNNLSLYTDFIQFKCLGNIKREVGEVIFLNTTAGLMENRYRGVWFIVKIEHSFSDKTYFNDIVCVRTDEMRQIYQTAPPVNNKNREVETRPGV